MIDLREFEQRDAESIVAHANNPAVSKYLRDIFPSPYTVKDAEWWLSEGCLVADTLNRAIVLNDSCIGSIGVTFQQAEHRFSAEIGYWIGEQHWNHGFGSAAIKQLTELVFSEHEIRRIYAPVAGENKASMRILEKSGYECEGIFRNNLCLRGKLYDEHIYAIHT